MKQILNFLLLTFSLLGIAHTEDLPTWTSSDGRTMLAKFLKLDGEAVVMEKNRKEFTVPFAKLSPASVAQAKKAALANRPKREPIAPAATAEPGEPRILSFKDAMITDRLMADGVKVEFRELLPLHCDEMGDLVVPMGVLTARGIQRGLVKLSGYDGNVVGSVAHQELTDEARDLKVVQNPAGDFITAGSVEGVNKPHDVAVEKVDGASGKMLWKWRYDGARHGDDRLGGLALDAAGNVIVAINAGAIPVPKEPTIDPYAPAASLDSVVVKLDTKTGKPVWEARDHAVAGTEDVGRLSDTQPRGVVLMGHHKEGSPNRLLGLDPATGKVLWQVEGGGMLNYKVTAQVTNRGILHSDGKHWMLTGFDGKNLWSVPMLFKDSETIMAGGETSAWIEWLLQEIKGDYKEVRYTSTVGLLQLKDGSLTVRKEPLAGPSDLANPAPPGQLEYPYYAGVQDKSGDLIFLACGPNGTSPYQFKPRLSRISAKEGKVVWTKDIATVAIVNPGYRAFFRMAPDGNLLYLWQEATEEMKPSGTQKASVFSLAKISAATGGILWHQRVRGHLGGTVSATNWQLDYMGNIFLVFSAPGRYWAGLEGQYCQFKL